jgi:hypothetical protein
VRGGGGDGVGGVEHGGGERSTWSTACRVPGVGKEDRT